MIFLYKCFNSEAFIIEYHGGITMEYKVYNIYTKEEKAFLTLEQKNHYLSEQYASEMKWLPSDFIIYQLDEKEWIWRETK